MTTTINISLPKPLRDHVEGQAKRQHYSASEYVRHLIREDMKRSRENLLDEYLSLSLREAEAGYVASFDVDKIMATAKAKTGRARAKRG